jgi:hypothetical protein
MTALIDRNELLAQAGDRLVLAGKMVPSAVADLVTMFGPKCVVDTLLNAVTLNGDSLDDAVAKELAKRDYWKPVSKDDPAVSARADLEAGALSGNVTMHGRLMKALGEADYRAWCKTHGAQAGRAAKVNEEDHSKNPFATGDTKEMARIIKVLGTVKAASMARSAGRSISGQPLRGIS